MIPILFFMLYDDRKIHVYRKTEFIKRH
ncbi:hypothetical protein D0413_06720 [Staphylococcus epidermidis]|nr:hypothetical protein [Staphylococcus epidermidis]MBM0811340.1 hypothetical protein [Staphylococcus epidermidis]PBJ85198.1 hypothetical protein CLR87_09600 [Staphylococcus epidermidis]PIH38935.1 hypothetical protein CTJ11_07435 [Staphylococcus epidermidis]RNM23467.1 hypothetical protein EFY84_02230 [Staphylococcus epidermidis]